MVISPGAPSMYVEIITKSSASSPSYRPYYRDSVTVTLKGQETTLVQILSVFMSLDLSNNNFKGIIPKEIGDLKFLKGLISPEKLLHWRDPSQDCEHAAAGVA